MSIIVINSEIDFGLLSKCILDKASHIQKDGYTNLIVTVNLNFYDDPVTELSLCLPSNITAYVVVTDSICITESKGCICIQVIVEQRLSKNLSRFIKFNTTSLSSLFNKVGYLDSNYRFEPDFLEKLDARLSSYHKYDICFFLVYPQRTAFEELLYCIESGKVSGLSIILLLTNAIFNSFPSLKAMTYDGSFFIIQGNHPNLFNAFSIIYENFVKCIPRDQLYLSSALTISNVRVGILPGSSSDNSLGLYRQNTHSISSGYSKKRFFNTKQFCHRILYSRKKSKFLNLVRLILLLLKP